MNRIKHNNMNYFIDEFVASFCVDGPKVLVDKISDWPWKKQKRVVSEVLRQTNQFANKSFWQELDSWYEEKQMLNHRPKGLPRINERRYYKSTKINKSNYTYLRIPVGRYSDIGGDLFVVSFEEDRIIIRKKEEDNGQ